MKLEKWALIAEIIGSVAIVASLIILVFEVRENTAAIQASSRQSISGRIEERAMDVAANPGLLRGLVRVQAGAKLDEGSPELVQMRFFYSSLLTSVEEAFLQFQDRRLEQEYFEARAARAIRPNFLNPTGRDYLVRARRQGSYSEGFLDWIDEAYPATNDIGQRD